MNFYIAAFSFLKSGTSFGSFVLANAQLTSAKSFGDISLMDYSTLSVN